MYKALFSDRKATHAAAYLLHRAGGSMTILKLMKLVYMAEKLSYHRHGDPLIGDEPFSLKDGPILSAVYDRAKGNLPEHSIWPTLIAPRVRNDVSLLDPQLNPDILGSLSDADVAVLDAIWRKFGKMTGAQLRDHTHKFPEWEDPIAKNVKRLTIKAEKLLMSVGFHADEAAEKHRELADQAKMQELLCTAR